MIKKLKVKFVIVIMSITTIMLAAIFGFVMRSTLSSAEQESIRMMRQMAFQPVSPPPAEPFERPTENIRLPYFMVIVKADGTIDAFGDAYYDLTDKKRLSELVGVILSKKEEVGLIADLDLRYLKTDSPDFQKIIFADVSSEKAIMTGLIRNCIIIGLISYAFFFATSLLLAKWVTMPVEKTLEEQKRFIADTSHELKTPLTVIMTNAEMLEDDGYSENDKQRFGKNILSMSKRMRGLVESLLELARMDSGAIKYVRATLDFSKLVSDAMLPFEPLFYEKGMEISCVIDENIRVCGDKAKLEQVVGILLDNALKYSTSDKPVEVSLTRRRSHCVLAVSSGGAPISKEDCKNIFKRFYCIDKSRNDGQSYGLGLSIAYCIIAEHGGEIRAESQNGRNSFYVTLANKPY